MIKASSYAWTATSVILIALLAGCPATLYSLHSGDLAPSVANIAPDARVAIWRHAVTVLLDQGYVPQVLDESAGYINAHRRDDLVDDALAGTVALLTISTDGVVRVALAGAGTFHSQADFLRAMSERQTSLLGLIVAAPGPAAATPGPPTAAAVPTTPSSGLNF